MEVRGRLGSLAVSLGKAGSQAGEASAARKEVASREVTGAKATEKAEKALVVRRAAGKVKEREAQKVFVGIAEANITQTNAQVKEGK